jgi:RNA polymerase sigma factor (sigma-70 family)
MGGGSTTRAEGSAPPLPDDALLEAVRAGYREAFLVLYDRHRDLAWRVARSVVTSDVDAEDAVAEGFARMLDAVQRHDVQSFRSYLAATVRHAGIDLHRRRDRVVRESLPEPVVMGAAVEEAALSWTDDNLVGRAFAALDERHRVALWLAEVEGFSTAEVGAVVDTSANGAAALLVRARERLRQCFLAEHLARPQDPACADVSGALAEYVRGSASRRTTRRVEDHLDLCDACIERLDEVRSVNTTLAAALPAVPVSLRSGQYVLDRWAAGIAPARVLSATGGPVGVPAGLANLAPVAPGVTEAATLVERAIQPVAAVVAGLFLAGASVVAAPSAREAAAAPLRGPAAPPVVAVPSRGPEAHTAAGLDGEAPFDETSPGAAGPGPANDPGVAQPGAGSPGVAAPGDAPDVPGPSSGSSPSASDQGAGASQGDGGGSVAGDPASPASPVPADLIGRLPGAAPNVADGAAGAEGAAGGATGPSFGTPEAPTGVPKSAVTVDPEPVPFPAPDTAPSYSDGSVVIGGGLEEVTLPAPASLPATSDAIV